MVLNSSEKPIKKHKKGLWSPEEDQRLKDYILRHGISCWSSVPINAGLQRNGKSCRLRWINYLRPGLKRGMFSTQEEETILTLHHTLGNKWSQIAKNLPGRTDNEIKNYWHSYLKKKTAKFGETNETKFGSILSTEENDPFVLNPTIKATRVGQEIRAQEQGLESLLPRLVFAEWLPDDNLQGQNIQSYQPTCYKNEYDFTTEKQDDFMIGFGYTNEAVAGSSSSNDDKFCQQVGDDLQKGILDLPYKFQDHQSECVTGYMDLTAGDMVNNGFLSLPAISLYKGTLF